MTVEKCVWSCRREQEAVGHIGRPPRLTGANDLSRRMCSPRIWWLVGKAVDEGLLAFVPVACHHAPQGTIVSHDVNKTDVTNHAEDK